ncbi:polyhedrin [Penaeus vannamei nudivirus]|nr:polyhedrin [Penaeus vannamei nucleopolyhedrovirus]
MSGAEHMEGVERVLRDLNNEEKLTLGLSAVGGVVGATKMMNEAAELRRNYGDRPYERLLELSKRKYESTPTSGFGERLRPSMAEQLDRSTKRPRKANRFPVNTHYNMHKICKRTNLTSSKLLGFSGQAGQDIPKYNSAVTLPLEALEFWVGDNINPEVAHSMGSKVLSDKECRVKSMKLKLSNLQVYEDRQYGSGDRLSETAKDVSCFVIPVESYMGSKSNGTLCKMFSANTSANSNVGDFITTKDIMMGKLVTKSDVDRMNVNPEMYMWSSEDGSLELEFNQDNGLWFRMPELRDGVYHLLPMESGIGASALETYTIPESDDEILRSTTTITPLSSAIGSLLIGVPYIIDASGKQKDYRVSFMVEQEITLECRAEWMQSSSASDWNAGMGATLTPRSTNITEFRHMVGPYNVQAEHGNRMKMHQTHQAV